MAFEKNVDCLECFYKSKERSEIYLNSGLGFYQASLLFDRLYENNHINHMNDLEIKYGK
jgi:hypothetical protein